MDIYIPIFDRTPETLDKDIVKDPASSVHADQDLFLQQLLRKIQRSELNALIAVKYLRLAVVQGFPEAFHAKGCIQRVAEPPRQDITAEPIHQRRPDNRTRGPIEYT